MREYQEQIAFVKWVRTFYPSLTIFHIPNGEARNIATGFKLKQMGVLKGIPDLYIIELHLAIEMKTKKGALSKDQKKLYNTFINNGHYYIVGFGFKDSVEKFKLFLHNKKVNF